MNATAEQIKRAEEAKIRFPHMKLERLIEIEMKKDAKSQWSPMSKKEIAKAESRTRIENGEVVVNFDLAERNLENAKKNLHSSLR